MKFQKGLATAHLLEFAVGGPPFQPCANPPRQGPAGQGGIGSQDPFNPGDGCRAEWATANLHAICVAPPTLSVKCVRGPAPRGERAASRTPALALGHRVTRSAG